ncbi:MAG: SAM-dependent methyltransferase [Syntrophus sp. (in: bacteria)]|nr:SAM-dependent methyltransferase [Syntrophus sp. (in: bacteria)]
MDKDVLDKQCTHWDDTLSNMPDMFGKEESETAQKALEVFQQEGITRILELGGGQGRDTVFFAQNGMYVDVIDYTENGVRIIDENTEKACLKDHVSSLCHDMRKGLPYEEGSFDGCYAHQVLCMALTTAELEFLIGEVRRVLRPGGVFIYTVRNTDDAHFQQGIHRGEDLYEKNGFIVHYFSREKIEILARGFDIMGVGPSEEGRLPRRLFRVTLKKTG